MILCAIPLVGGHVYEIPRGEARDDSVIRISRANWNKSIANLARQAGAPIPPQPHIPPQAQPPPAEEEEEEVDAGIPLGEEEEASAAQLRPWRMNLADYNELVDRMENIHTDVGRIQTQQEFLYEQQNAAREEAHKRNYDYMALFSQVLGQPPPAPYDPPVYQPFPPRVPQ